jgi:hypothetical protein
MHGRVEGMEMVEGKAQGLMIRVLGGSHLRQERRHGHIVQRLGDINSSALATHKEGNRLDTALNGTTQNIRDTTSATRAQSRSVAVFLCCGCGCRAIDAVCAW